MSNANDPAYPMVGGPQEQYAEPWERDGLTKREYIATKIFTAIYTSTTNLSYAVMAREAVEAAESLLAVLED